MSIGVCMCVPRVEDEVTVCHCLQGLGMLGWGTCTCGKCMGTYLPRSLRLA